MLRLSHLQCPVQHDQQMDKHGMCLQLHVSVGSGGPEVLLYDGPGLSGGATSDAFKTPGEDISVHILILGMTRLATH